MRAILRRLGFRAHVLVVNDALIALVAGAGEEPGVVVIAGTGSIAYGVNADGSRRAPAAGDTCSATKGRASGSAARP